jgi:hypothetical protein
MRRPSLSRRSCASARSSSVRKIVILCQFATFSHKAWSRSMGDLPSSPPWLQIERDLRFDQVALDRGWSAKLFGPTRFVRPLHALRACPGRSLGPRPRYRLLFGARFVNACAIVATWAAAWRLIRRVIGEAGDVAQVLLPRDRRRARTNILPRRCVLTSGADQRASPLRRTCRCPHAGSRRVRRVWSALAHSRNS